MQGGDEIYAAGGTSINKMPGRENIIIGTWNVRTLGPEGKLQELIWELNRYTWHIVGLCEVRWKKSGGHLSDDGHILYYSGEVDTRTNGVGFLLHKNIKNSVLEWSSISSRLISVRLRAAPFNITVVQVYAPTSTRSDQEIEAFYTQLQTTINSVENSDILIIQGDWNAKVGVDIRQDWYPLYGPSCNAKTNKRGLRLLKFASNNKMVLANTLGDHEASRRWTWHSPDKKCHNQIDYILVQNRFRSWINTAKTRTFPGANVGSDHDLVLLNFKTSVKKISKPKITRLKFNLDRLKDPAFAKCFQVVVSFGATVAGLLTLDADAEKMTTMFNKLMTETAEEILGKHHRKAQPWVSDEILDMRDTRRRFKQLKITTEAEKYEEERRKIMKAKENWIEKQCTHIEESLGKNNSNRVYQVVKELTQQRWTRASAIEDKYGKCLTKEKAILDRGTEYCSNRYNHRTQRDRSVPKSQDTLSKHNFPILREEVEAAIRSLQNGKAAGVDNVPAELLKYGGTEVIDILTKICNKIWQTGQWPTPWTQSLIITLPNKGNLRQCQNYRTISLKSHASEVMLKVILNRLKPHAEEIMAEEQAGFRCERSMTELIFNLRVLSEKYSQHQQCIYHVFIYFEKACDRVWHKALWATMNKYNIDQKLIQCIKGLYSKATGALLVQGTVREWFRTRIGVRQGCLLSPTLFNIVLTSIMTDALESYSGTVSIGGRKITNLRYADNIVGLAGSEQELANLVKSLDETSSRYGLKISAEKTKLMTNSSTSITRKITVSGKELQTVKLFKYLGAIISEEGSETEVSERAVQTRRAMAKLKTIWSDNNISLKSKVRLLYALIYSIFLYACESWTVTPEIQKIIQRVETRSLRNVLDVSDIEKLRRYNIQPFGYDHLLTIVKKRKLEWYGHITRSNGLSKTILCGTEQGERSSHTQRKKWIDDIAEWTGKSFAKLRHLHTTDTSGDR